MSAPLPPIALEVAVLLLGVFLLLAESFSKSEDKTWIAKLSICVLTVVFAFSFFTTGNPAPAVPEISQGPASMQPPGFWSFYSADPIAHFFKRIALLTTIVVLVMAIEYRSVLVRFLPQAKPGGGIGEFFALPVFTCAGLMFMASAVDFILIFISLELVTISFYVLVPYLRRHPASLEAGVKYLILGALSTGFLVYGITWIFGLTGETNLANISRALPALFHENGRLHGSETALLFGIMLVLVGLGFKIAAAPFQLWVPDVYQGAPTPITAFLSVGSKAAGFIVLLRVLEPFLVVDAVRPKVLALLGILAGATLLYGNLAAMPQDNLKRLLAYSSIGHAGYLLIAVASVGVATETFGSAGTAIAFYLAAYLLMTLLSFLVMIVVANHSRGDDILHFNGLAQRSPFLAGGMLAAMLSLAGLPFTAGFIGKFLVFATAVAQKQFWLVGIGAVTVAAGFYFYLRVVTAMYWEEPNDDTPIKIGPLTRVTIGGLTVLVFVFGIFPQPILTMLKPSPAPVAAAHASAATAK
ncbi:MAG: NADH-quinone oxidoreductase subunit N [Verrucomicrobiota bacterium]|nr:NADH-quinone oxidoreductase subunit N [Verrucomicrobiota bacterium]